MNQVQYFDDSTFLLYRQKIVSVQTKLRDHRYEVLLRQKDGNRVVSAFPRLQEAEEFGWIQLLDHWVLHRVISHLANMRIANKLLDRSPDNCIHHVNLSGASISNPDLLEHVYLLFKQYKIEPSQITFEITEHSIVNSPVAAQNCNAFRLMGCGIVLDDFDAGALNFDHIKSLAPHGIKISGNRFKSSVDDNLDREIVQALIRVARCAGVEVVAEGVETEREMQWCQFCGVHWGQGWILGEPEPLS